MCEMSKRETLKMGPARAFFLSRGRNIKSHQRKMRRKQVSGCKRGGKRIVEDGLVESHKVHMLHML